MQSPSARQRRLGGIGTRGWFVPAFLARWGIWDTRGAAQIAKFWLEMAFLVVAVACKKKREKTHSSLTWRALCVPPAPGVAATSMAGMAVAGALAPPPSALRTARRGARATPAPLCLCGPEPCPCHELVHIDPGHEHRQNSISALKRRRFVRYTAGRHRPPAPLVEKISLQIITATTLVKSQWTHPLSLTRYVDHFLAPSSKNEARPAINRPRDDDLFR